MTRLRRVTAQTFHSLRVRNFRLYFFGQLVSVSGTWMQSIAQAWLVLRLTDSGVALGITTALQFLPVLLAGAWGGVVADRVDKRKLIIGTQTAAGVLALVLGVLTATGVVQLWQIYLLAFLLGCVTALDNPARRAFVVEMVGVDDVTNAVSLSSAMFTTSRIIGPAIGGLLIATVGIAWCFYANAISYLAAIGVFVAMDPSRFFSAPVVPREKGQIRAGLSYAWRHPLLRLALLMTVLIGTLSFNFQVVLPLLAKQTFHSGAGTFGTLYALMSAGSVIGALFTANRTNPTRRFLTVSAAAFGVAMVLAAAAPSLEAAMVLLVGVGATSVSFQAMANAVLQVYTEPQMRGRVMALYSVAFLGSTPIGGPIVGWISQAFGARAGLLVGALAAFAAAALAVATSRGARRRPAVATDAEDTGRLAAIA